MDLEAIREKSIEDLTPEDRVRINEHWDELTDELKEKFASVHEESTEQAQTQEPVSSG